MRSTNDFVYRKAPYFVRISTFWAVLGKKKPLSGNKGASIIINNNEKITEAVAYLRKVLK